MEHKNTVLSVRWLYLAMPSMAKPSIISILLSTIRYGTMGVPPHFHQNQISCFEAAGISAKRGAHDPGLTIPWASATSSSTSRCLCPRGPSPPSPTAATSPASHEPDVVRGHDDVEAEHALGAQTGARRHCRRRALAKSNPVRTPTILLASALSTSGSKTCSRSRSSPDCPCWRASPPRRRRTTRNIEQSRLPQSHESTAS